MPSVVMLNVVVQNQEPQLLTWTLHYKTFYRCNSLPAVVS
jgi:hypothetical protein